ncbi:glycoside hydrolase family 5 protein [Paenibacillus sp. MMO-177]|uniref:glycoside hydrolase family 5 protein n=1 Tax=Paenibacillus sp. MMO-177 TaxID=3081289 RepID=UPI003018F9B5
MSNNPLPRWRGFNLVEMFSTNTEWQQIFPYEDDGQFLESDFRLISKLGFDFARIPLSYLFWNSGTNLYEMNENTLRRIDQAVEWGLKYNVHVSLDIHRAPGYCINDYDKVNEPNKLNLWKDREALQAFSYYWSRFAERYKSVPGDALSFDLLNEPTTLDSMPMQPSEYVHVVTEVVKAIRQVDANRPIIANGLDGGNTAVPELAPLGIGQSCRGYDPWTVSHYKAIWGGNSQKLPTWPNENCDNVIWNKEKLHAKYEPWSQLMAQGVGIHCGEMGCHRETPHDVFLGWMNDLLEVLTSRNIGYALWNFRGPFGLLNSGRSDVIYKSIDGYLLDEKLLKLLERY